MIRFHAPAPWAHITKALKAAKRRTIVTAYLGTGAAKMLNLAEGDVLIVNASLGNVRVGSVNPKELLKVRKGGKVRLFNASSLHAKVYLADNRVFVGSMNGSKVSRDALLEACLETTNAESVKAVRAWVHTLMSDPLKKERIEKLAEEYRPPRFKGRRRTSAKRDKVSRTWIIGRKNEIDATLTPANQETVDEAAKGLPGDVEPEEIWMRPGSRITKLAAPGDELFVIDRNGPKNKVFAPRRILTRPLKQKHEGRDEVVIVYEPHGRKTMPFTTFRKLAKAAGITLPKSARTARSINARAAQTLRAALD
jgi:hypothetical protein